MLQNISLGSTAGGMTRLGSPEWGTATETLQRVGGGAWLVPWMTPKGCDPPGHMAWRILGRAATPCSALLNGHGLHGGCLGDRQT